MRLNVSPVAGWTGDGQGLRAVADIGVASAAVADAAVETSFDRVVDGATPVRVSRRRTARKVAERAAAPALMLAVPIVVAAFGAVMYLAEEPYVSTDDAFVRAAKVTVNARVAGQAVEIAVRDNQRVRQGQVLFRIDPEAYQIAVDQAEARLGSARLQIDSLKATYRQQQAELQSARDSAAFDEREYDRKKRWSSPILRRARCSSAPRRISRSPASTSHRIEQQIANTVVALDGDPDIENDRPSDGSCGQGTTRPRPARSLLCDGDGARRRHRDKVDDLQVGGFVNPGAPVFSLLSSKRVWIEANFRGNRPDPHAAGSRGDDRRRCLSGSQVQRAHRQHESGHWF